MSRTWWAWSFVVSAYRAYRNPESNRSRELSLRAKAETVDSKWSQYIWPEDDYDYENDPEGRFIAKGPRDDTLATRPPVRPRKVD